VGHSGQGKQVLSGYREAWENVGKASSQGAALLQLFIRRSPEYARAVHEDEESAKIEGKAFSRLALVFGGHIRVPDCTPTEGGSAEMLTMTHANVYYSAHYEGVAEALKIAGLLDAR
jgi:hypothetical protein